MAVIRPSFFRLRWDTVFPVLALALVCCGRSEVHVPRTSNGAGDASAGGGQTAGGAGGLGGETAGAIGGTGGNPGTIAVGSTTAGNGATGEGSTTGGPAAAGSTSGVGSGGGSTTGGTNGGPCVQAGGECSAGSNCCSYRLYCSPQNICCDYYGGDCDNSGQCPAGEDCECGGCCAIAQTPCRVDRFPYCCPGLTCVVISGDAGYCRGRVGLHCAEDSDCSSHSCRAGACACVAKHFPCALNSDCCSGWCDSSRHCL